MADVRGPQDTQHVPTAGSWPAPKVLSGFIVHRRGTVLQRQGDAVQSVHLIGQGIIKVLRSESNGRDVLVALRGPGWMLGAAGVILGGPSEFTAVCASSCRAQSLPATEFRLLHATDSSVSAWIAQMLATEIRQQGRRMGQFVLSPSLRLRRLLIELAAGLDGSVGTPVHLRHHELAEAIGVARETVSRLFSRLEATGELSRVKGSVEIRMDHPREGRQRRTHNL